MHPLFSGTDRNKRAPQSSTFVLADKQLQEGVEWLLTAAEVVSLVRAIEPFDRPIIHDVDSPLIYPRPWQRQDGDKLRWSPTCMGRSDQGPEGPHAPVGDTLAHAANDFIESLDELLQLSV